MRGLVPAIVAVGNRAGVGLDGVVRAVVCLPSQRYLHETANRAVAPLQTSGREEWATLQESPANDQSTEPTLPGIYGRNHRAHKHREQRGLRSRLVPGLEDYNLRGNEHESSWETSKPPVEALYTALRIGTPQAVLRCLIRLTLVMTQEELELLWKKIPSTTFSEILRCLDPDHFLGEYQEKYKSIPSLNAQQLGLPESGYPTYYQFSQLFLREIIQIIRARSQFSTPTLADYSYLFRCARATGNLRVATGLWFQLQRSELKPNVECYNSYIAVKCWSETSHPGSVYSGRVMERNSAPRAWGVYPVSRPGHQILHRPGVIKKEILGLFQQMVSSGLSGDETTFCFMMVAFARTGDMQSVEAMLRRVWRIDVEALLLSQNREPPAKQYSRNSSLYPTNQLLFTIAHAYGINNQIPTALRVMDYVSRQYSIVLDHDVSMELMGWTYEVSHFRGATRRWLWLTKGAAAADLAGPRDESFETQESTSSQDKEVNDVGTPLPRTAVANLYYTLIAEPYNIKPTIELLDYPIKASLNSQSFVRLQELMRVGRDCARQDVYLLNRMKRDTKLVFSKDKRHPALQEMIQALHLQQLKVRNNRLVIRSWVDRLLKVKYQDHNLHKPKWHAIFIPDILREWDTYLNNTVTYHTTTGYVTIQTETWKLNQLKQWHYQYGEKSRGLRYRRVSARSSKAVNPSDLERQSAALKLRQAVNERYLQIQRQRTAKFWRGRSHP
jgi:hypothetical protein